MVLSRPFGDLSLFREVHDNDNGLLQKKHLFLEWKLVKRGRRRREPELWNLMEDNETENYEKFESSKKFQIQKGTR